MMSRVSMERFVDNLGVLAGLTGQELPPMDETQKKAFEHWTKLVQHLKDIDFFKKPSATAHI